MHLATVDGRALTTAFKRMAGIRGGKMGAAFWRFTQDLVIDWAGMEETLPGTILHAMPHGVLVASDSMQHMTGAMTYDGPTDIRLLHGRLHVGRDSVPAAPAAGPRRYRFAIDAGPSHLLRALLQEPEGALEADGFAAECEAVRERWHESLHEAAKVLAWTGLDEATLTRLVEAELGGQGG